jgi:hypothetical protein
LLSCGSVGIDCTEIGCSDGVNITFDSEITTHGNYVFVVTLDGVPTTCEYSLPFVEIDGAYGSCDREGISLTLSGTALDESQHSIPYMYIPSSPEAISIEITRDGSSIASTSFVPEYEESAPNGKECGPICYSAGTKIEISN